MAKSDRPNVDYGDGEVARSNEILRSLVGSGVHGIAIENQDDRDEMGVFVEPPENVIGVSGPLDHYVWRTQPEGVRSGPGDIDLTCYSLRKYLRLALSGNPTILLPLYAPDSGLIVESKLGTELRELTPKIVSRQAGRRFLGYLDQQYERMLGGGKRNRVPKRPEQLLKYGFDAKYASHAVRLGLQGVELMDSGRLALPMLDHARDLCLQVKKGELSFEETVALIGRLRERLARLLDHPESSPLPEYPDYDTVNAWAIGAHLYHWQTK